MKKILYVYGYNSNENSETRTNLQKVLGRKFIVDSVHYNQLQPNEAIEYLSSYIINTGYDNYYITLTCWCDKKYTKYSDYKNSILGIDMGIIDNVTCSDGKKFNVYVEETEHLKKLQAKLVRQVKDSNNYHKTVLKIRKEYDHINNKRNDIANKLVHQLLSENAIIVCQDEQIASWKNPYKNKEAEYASSQVVHHSVLGRIKAKLMQSDRVVVLDKWMPTTQHCFKCGANTPHKVDKRIFTCAKCGNSEDRDIHAAQNMVNFYISYVNKSKSDTPGTGDTVKPASRKISYRNFCNKQEDATFLVLH